MAVKFKWSFELYMLKVENRAMNRVNNNIYNFNHNEKDRRKQKFILDIANILRKCKDKREYIEITNL